MKANRYDCFSARRRLPSSILYDGWWLADPVNPRGSAASPPYPARLGGCSSSATIIRLAPRPARKRAL